MQVLAIQVGHHDAVRTVIANVGLVNPDHLVVVQLHQQRFHMAAGDCAHVAHGADVVAADDLDALANQAGDRYSSSVQRA